MNINQGGVDGRFGAQYQGSQSQTGAPGFSGGLGGVQGLQSVPNTAFGLQSQLQNRAPGLGGIPSSAAQSNMSAQRLGSLGVPSGMQQQLGLQQPSAGRMGIPGQQQYGAGVNGVVSQGVRIGGSGSMNIQPYQSLAQQGSAPPGGPPSLGGRPGGVNIGLGGGMGGVLGGLGPGGLSNMAAFQQQQQQQQRGLGGMHALGSLGPRTGTLGGVGGGYTAPSGDLLSMLNKVGGLHDDGPQFNAADFPSLGAVGQPGARHTSQDGATESFATLLNNQKAPTQLGPAFGEEDFPALPGSGGGSTTGGGISSAPQSRSDGSAGAAQLHQLQQQLGASEAAMDALRLQHQQRQGVAALKPGFGGSMGGGVKPVAAPGGISSATSGGGVPTADKFGLLGLLSVISLTDRDASTLALGTDLTTLGLNLNSPEALWKTFASPWADGPTKTEPDFRLPACYLAPPPRLSPAYFSRFQPDTLFYIFYGMPGDEAQIYAADELANRGWYYHKELKVWLTRAPNTEPLQKTDRFERGSFFVFDPTAWDVVRKDNFSVSFDALERPPGLLKAGGVMAQPNPTLAGLPPGK